MISPNPCTLIPPGAGPAYWVVGDHITFKLTADQTRGAFSFAETIVAPGGGPPPHVHHREDEMFYILDGQFAFILGGQSFTGTTGDAFYLPKDIVHTFKNISAAPGRLLVGAAPSGFENFVPEAGCPCDDATPTAPPVNDAAIGKLMAACARHGLEIRFDFQPGPPAPPRAADRKFRVQGAHARLKLTSADTGGKFSMVEMTVDPGAGVETHTHREMDEVFYVLEGSLDFDLDGRRASATPGTFIHVPSGAPCGFRNSGGTPARLLDCHSPADQGVSGA